jgi:hypothetical protein
MEGRQPTASVTMAMARSLTTSRVRNNYDEPAMPNRLLKPSKSVANFKISAPVLLSTTNVQTINANDVATAQKMRKVSSVSSASSGNSDKESDASSSPRSRGTSVTDNSSVGSSPSSPRPGDSDSFTSSPSPRRAKSSFDLKSRSLPREPPPSVPARAPTHSKLAHEQLARKKSLQNLPARPPPPRSVPPPPPVPPVPPITREQRASADMFRATVAESHHPFGKELEQLDEIAEEFGGVVRDAAREADLRVMRTRGLKKFCAEDYMADLTGLFAHYFPAPAAARPVGWI